METAIKDFISQIDQLPPIIAYLFLFASAFLQITFPPYPGDTLLVFGGYLGSTGVLGGSIPLFMSYWLGTLLTSYALYVVGYREGESILKSKIITRYFPIPSQAKAKRWVLKFGLPIFFVCKFIPGINSLIIIFGGVFRYKKIWAYSGIGTASFVHNLLFFLAGRSVGNNWDKISNFLAVYNRSVIAVVSAAAILYGAYWLWARYYKTPKTE